MSDDGIVIQNPGVPNQGQDLNPEQNTQSEVKITEAESEQPFEQVDASSEDAQDESVKSENIEQDDQKLQSVENEEPASFKKRINKVFAEKRAAEQRALLLEQELARARGYQQQPAQQQFVDPYAPREPDENDPKYANNNKAYLRDYVTYQKQLITYEAQKGQQLAYEANVAANYNRQVEEARGKYEDFDESIEKLTHLPIPATFQTQEVINALQELDNGAYVAYYFAKKCPDDFTRLFNMPVRKAVLELGKISAKLNAPISTKPNSPPPPKNLKGTGILHQKKSINDLSIDEMSQMFRKMR